MGVKTSVGAAVFVLGVAVFIMTSRYDPESSVSYTSTADLGYQMADVVAPRLAGWPLQLFSNILHTPPFDHFLIQFLLNDNKFFKVRKFAQVTSEIPKFYPVYSVSPAETAKHQQARDALDLNAFAAKTHEASTSSFRRRTAADYVRAYKSGRLTPTQVAERMISAIEASNRLSPPLNAFIAFQPDDIRRQAKESTDRYMANKPLGIFDGVPVGVKDEVDVKGYRSAIGTKFLGINTVAKEDAWGVDRLRAAGALIAGKLNMHEIGIGTTGHNAHWGCCRNAYNTSHYPGGSSSGSASAVSAGLVVIGVGCDGGGSIRIPAALNGIVGLKHTFRRESHRGAYALEWSVGHMGPMTGTVADAAAAYVVMSERDPKDSHYGGLAPPSHLQGFDDVKDLSDVRIGVFWPYFNHTSASIRDATKIALNALRQRGARIVDISIPHLDVIRLAHSATIISEMLTNMDPFIKEHLSDFSAETRINLGLARGLTARDYLASNQVRAYGTKIFQDIYTKVDVVAMPATAITAPYIPADAVEAGETNLAQTTELMRYSFLGNLLGLPAIVVPVGQDMNNLPIGLQFMATAWNEALVLRMGHATEDCMLTSSNSLQPMKQPQIYYDLLS